MIACEQLLNEVRRALAGPYFRDRVTRAERDAIPSMLAALSDIAPDPGLATTSSPRPL